MQLTNPCRKCIVRACCTDQCEQSIEWNKKIDFVMCSTPIGSLVSMVKEKEWILLFLIVAEMFLMIMYLVLEIRGEL